MCISASSYSINYATSAQSIACTDIRRAAVSPGTNGSERREASSDRIMKKIRACFQFSDSGTAIPAQVQLVWAATSPLMVREFVQLIVRWGSVHGNVTYSEPMLG